MNFLLSKLVNLLEAKHRCCLSRLSSNRSQITWHITGLVVPGILRKSKKIAFHEKHRGEKLDPFYELLVGARSGEV